VPPVAVPIKRLLQRKTELSGDEGQMFSPAGGGPSVQACLDRRQRAFAGNVPWS